MGTQPVEAEQNARLERNLAAFERHAPVIYRRLKAISEPGSKLVGSLAEGNLNLDLGHTAFYAPDAVTFSKDQVKAFLDAPLRFYLHPPPPPAVIQYQHEKVIKGLLDHFKEAEVSEIPRAPLEHTGFLLVWGIGLGFHIEPLIEALDFRNLLLVEQYPEFIYQSLKLQDWAGWFEKIAARGGSIAFFVNDEPEQISQGLYWHMRGNQFGLLDGSYIYRHYSSLVMNASHESFRDSLPVLSASIGFFEDEKVMLTNCFANLVDNDFALIQDRPLLEKPVPAFIVGSGPSVDTAIAKIRECGDRAVVISCGTGLGVLLRNGIRPDFHCEMENVPAVVEHLTGLRDKFGFEGLRLIASTTVDPSTPKLFKDLSLYFRDTVSSTELFARGIAPIYGGSPTVTNLGLRMAITLGFGEIYLFGVDLGARKPAEHHSKDSIYVNDKTWAKNYAKNIEKMTIRLPANFGGESYTNRVLLWSRVLMQGVLESYPGLRVFNCSDGALIGGTTPKLPRSIKLSVTPQDKAMTLARIRKELGHTRAGELLSPAQIVEARERFDAWYDSVLAAVRVAAVEKHDFLRVYDSIVDLFDEQKSKSSRSEIWSVNIGTLMMSFQFGYYFVRRLPESQRADFMRMFLATLETMVAAMREDLGALFGRMLTRLENAAAA